MARRQCFVKKPQVFNGPPMVIDFSPKKAHLPQKRLVVVKIPGSVLCPRLATKVFWLYRVSYISCGERFKLIN